MTSVSSPILLLDGGLGTTLESPPYNYEFSENTPLWSSDLLISSPSTLLDVQRSFVESGADVLLTATYQASFEGFKATRRSGVEGESGGRSYNKNEAGELMRSAVRIARKAFSSPRDTVEEENDASGAIDKRGLVALSLGAYGATMRPSQEYTGAYSPPAMRTVNALAKWHAERLAVYKEDPHTWKDVDLVAFETLPRLQEIEAARKVMAEANTGPEKKKWWLSCVFPNDDDVLPDGSSVESVVTAMLADKGEEWQRPWGVGINCTKVEKLGKLIAKFEETVHEVVKHGELEVNARERGAEVPWLVLYPDGAQGLVYNTTTQAWEASNAGAERDHGRVWDERVCEIVKKIWERNLWKGILVGGCCKTTPDDITRLRMRIDHLEQES
ncbi:hypothetical protein MMC06_003911 [Schaereria dolodes]|nr:hypothetical protein [Schaereria dolodes]